MLKTESYRSFWPEGSTVYLLSLTSQFEVSLGRHPQSLQAVLVLSVVSEVPCNFFLSHASLPMVLHFMSVYPA